MQESQDDRARAVATLAKEVGLKAVLEAYLMGSCALLSDPVVAEWVYQVGSRGFTGAELAQDWDAVRESAKKAV